MINKQIYQNHTKPIQGFLPLFSSLFPKRNLLDDPLLNTVTDFVNSLDLDQFESFYSWPAKRFPLTAMLSAALISFTLHGYLSCRKQAEFYENDVRILSLFNGFTPSHQTIFKFQQCLKPCAEDLFKMLNLWIEERDLQLESEVLYLDGSKWEANANKMTFVWTKSAKKWGASAWKHLIELVEKLNGWLKNHNEDIRISILKKPDPDYLLYIDSCFGELEKKYNVELVYGRGKRKHELQRMHDKFVDCAKKIIYYAVCKDLADGRNSFSKTDIDATFMHMKYDYYNHTNVFKPGYNIQFGVSCGYIRVVYISQNCNDVKDFIPTVEKYHELYGEYPEVVPADAGYGSFDNYTYCREKGIELLMKYPGQNKESEKVTDKNRFKSWAFGRDESGNPICPAGHTMDLVNERIDHKGVYPKVTSYYRTEKCQNCPLRSQCTKSARGRTIQICHEFEDMKKEVRENMSTDHGHELMVNRSIQAEGTFGDIKNNFGYDRLKRRGLSNAKLELYLVACGHNLRKFINRSRMDEAEKTRYGTQYIN